MAESAAAEASSSVDSTSLSNTGKEIKKPSTASNSATPPAAGSGQLIYTGLVISLSAVLLRAGLFNSLLVIAVSALLLCNPWVRTLLELPSAEGKSAFGRFDPARFLLSAPQDVQPESEKQKNGEASSSVRGRSEDDAPWQKDQLLSLSAMPTPLHDSSQRLIRLVVRDFVQNWYDNITFAHPNFLISAEANVSHLASSVYLRTSQLDSANISAELLLTVQSVILSSLRRRRVLNHNAYQSISPTSPYGAATAMAHSTWPNTTARIDSLRKAVRRLLARNLPQSERSSPIVMLLLTEIVAKQAWQVVQNISDPDFINQKIVQFAEPASETSLEGQTISQNELEDIKKLDASAVTAQPPTVQMPNVPGRPSNGPDFTSPAPSRPSSKGGPRDLDSIPALTPDNHRPTPPTLPPRQSQVSSGHSQQSSAPDMRPQQAYQTRATRTTPPSKSNGSGPLSALGGLASGAFGALADAAERAVDVVGGTVDEFGNLLMVPSDSPTSGRGSGRSSRRQSDTLAQNSLRESPPANGAGSRTYYLDMPSGLGEPPLPDSIRRSLNNASDSSPASARIDRAAQQVDGTGFQIPDTPERGSFETTRIVAPAPVSAAMSLPSRDSFAIEEEEDAGDAIAAMQELLSDQGSRSYEAFERYLENPSNPYCAPNEGEMLLRLHTQLNTLASIMEFAALDEQTFRADASSILSKALAQLPAAVPPTIDGSQPVLVRRSAQQVLTNLEWCANMDVVEPLREQIVLRLAQLYNAFMSTQAVSPSQGMYSTGLTRTDSPEPQHLKAFLERENRPSFSSVESERSPLRYEPRKKSTASSVSAQPGGIQTPPRAPSVPPGPVMGPPLGPSRPMSVPPRVPSAPPRPNKSSAQADSSQIARTSTDVSPSDADARRSADVARRSLEVRPPTVTVTDVSPNADTFRSVDVRSLEVMISVEGVDVSGDGFVLVRKWFEFEQMDAELRRQPRSNTPLPRLPLAKNRNSQELCRQLEAYVSELLSPEMRRQLSSVNAVRQFFDRTRAGASSEAVRQRGGPGAFLGTIGKNFVTGVSAVGKSSKLGLEMPGPVGSASFSEPQGSTGAWSPATTVTDRSTGPARRATELSATPSNDGRPSTGTRTRQTDDVNRGHPVPDSASSTTSAFVSRTNTPAPQEQHSELSAKDLDMILASIFAVADEAFNLQGGWTLRRGMLRVLEQVVRTTYASSVVATFNNSAAALNADNFARWITDLTNNFWPDGRWNTQGGPERTEAEKQRTADRAREIIVSYAPAQAGFMLGPGGRLACVKALATVHETVMDPITASDLGLTIVLKSLDLASR